MSEKQTQQKKTEPKRKLFLNRESVRLLEINDPNLLEGVAGGIMTVETNCPVAD